METTKRIAILGSGGLVGSALKKELLSIGYTSLYTPRSSELNLLSEQDTSKFFNDVKPQIVFFCAAQVGGIYFNNSDKFNFLFRNLKMEMNTIQACLSHPPEQFIFYGSSCIYPRNAPQPLKEEYLLTSELEKTNEAYALAKIIGIKLCSYLRSSNKKFYSVMPCNVYGPGDTYDEWKSHVIPALILKFHKAKIESAKEVEIWGTGNPLREFIYSEDLAKGVTTLLKSNVTHPDLINLGSSEEISIRQLAELVRTVVNVDVTLKFNTSLPDGTPRKIMDSSYIRSLGWSPCTKLKNGLQLAYTDFLNRQSI